MNAVAPPAVTRPRLESRGLTALAAAVKLAAGRGEPLRAFLVDRPATRGEATRFLASTIFQRVHHPVLRHLPETSWISRSGQVTGPVRRVVVSCGGIEPSLEAAGRGRFVRGAVGRLRRR
ncbi:hypothetical protein L0U85_11605 [Glycomyces sp. L485]|uniref:hypothetical protein n=1 Tax=Glycomyces sp. L485 TaxID=2909235 RepID=UPI001F4AFC19|nr:hypothetical protein [Glycomyces sp. L485]MCH7231491.1 hypothetical protein [Glycomyces sp. L485]